MKKESKKFFTEICGILETAYTFQEESAFHSQFDEESETRQYELHNTLLWLNIEYWAEKCTALYLGEEGGCAVLRGLGDENIFIPMSAEEYNEITCSL